MAVIRNIGWGIVAVVGLSLIAVGLCVILAFGQIVATPTGNATVIMFEGVIMFAFGLGAYVAGINFAKMQNRVKAEE